MNIKDLYYDPLTRTLFIGAIISVILSPIWVPVMAVKNYLKKLRSL